MRYFLSESPSSCRQVPMIKNIPGCCCAGLYSTACPTENLNAIGSSSGGVATRQSIPRPLRSRTQLPLRWRSKRFPWKLPSMMPLHNAFSGLRFPLPQPFLHSYSLYPFSIPHLLCVPNSPTFPPRDGSRSSYPLGNLPHSVSDLLPTCEQVGRRRRLAETDAAPSIPAWELILGEAVLCIGRDFAFPTTPTPDLRRCHSPFCRF